MGSEAAPAMEFHLTGFKKFHNVANNPTETLVTRAKQYVSNNPLPSGAEIKTCTVLETAGVGALDDLLAILDGALLDKKNPTQAAGLFDGDMEIGAIRQESPVVWIHLGVNSGATRFAWSSGQLTRQHSGVQMKWVGSLMACQLLWKMETSRQSEKPSLPLAKLRAVC
ncbi:hypothetical protein R1flu_012068 [Riccia fluitans]|uniref:Uncharacterized protein n=1 Tax=Riccia fluitans TaxID=41844 RepID=A0ABD1Z9L1_9MARC